MRWLLFALLALTACEQKTNADQCVAASIKAFDDQNPQVTESQYDQALAKAYLSACKEKANADSCVQAQMNAFDDQNPHGPQNQRDQVLANAYQQCRQ